MLREIQATGDTFLQLTQARRESQLPRSALLEPSVVDIRKMIDPLPIAVVRKTILLVVFGDVVIFWMPKTHF